MIGVCIRVITLLTVTRKDQGTYIDELLSLYSTLFIASAFISHMSLRLNNHRHLELAADIFFLQVCL